MQETGFKLKKSSKESSIKKLKTQKIEKGGGSNRDYGSGDQIQNIVIEKPLKIPIFRYTPSRMIMQRIINRYFALGDKVYDDMGNLITY